MAPTWTCARREAATRGGQPTRRARWWCTRGCPVDCDRLAHAGPACAGPAPRPSLPSCTFREPLDALESRPRCLWNDSQPRTRSHAPSRSVQGRHWRARRHRDVRGEDVEAQRPRLVQPRPLQNRSPRTPPGRIVTITILGASSLRLWLLVRTGCRRTPPLARRQPRKRPSVGCFSAAATEPTLRGAGCPPSNQRTAANSPGSTALTPRASVSVRDPVEARVNSERASTVRVAMSARLAALTAGPLPAFHVEPHCSRPACPSL